MKTSSKRLAPIGRALLWCAAAAALSATARADVITD